MATHHERLMAASSVVLAAAKAVVAARTPSEEDEAYELYKKAKALEEDVINSLPPRMRQETIEMKAQVRAEMGITE